MKTSNSGRAFIEQFEGLYLKTYNDGTGTLTIGYGHTTAAGPPKVYRGQTITKEQADSILSSDLGKVEQQVTNYVKVPLNQNQFDALVSFHFNTGALGRSTALKKLNAGDYTGCADALLAYNRGGGRVMAGLVRRRQAERKMFLTPSTTPAVATGTGVAVAGSSLSAYFHDHWLLIVGASILAAALIGTVVHLIRKGK